MIKQWHQASRRKAGSSSERLTSLLADALRSNKSQSLARPDFGQILTPGKKDILKLIAEGLSNKRIAANWDIKRRTVESPRKALLKKSTCCSAGGWKSRCGAVEKVCTNLSYINANTASLVNIGFFQDIASAACLNQQTEHFMALCSMQLFCRGHSTRISFAASVSQRASS